VLRCTLHPTFSRHRVWCVLRPLLPLSVRSSPRSDDDGSCCSRAARRFSPLHRFSRCLPTRAARQVWFDSYTLSGCHTAEYCGVFHRVAAHCASGRTCPGGDLARPGWSDATLCDGAPAYQRAGGGAMLYHYGTYWAVGGSGTDSSALGDCQSAGRQYYSSKEISGSDQQPSPLPPDAAGYGWSDPGGYEYGTRNTDGAIHIVAGGGGGGGR
jgi:hypothetical protein